MVILKKNKFILGGKTLITVKNLTKKYGDFVAIDNISFEIEDGQIIGLLGPNGAGKTTTMSLITGLIEPTFGEINVNGYDVIKESKKTKSQIGYMPEGAPLYSELTVKEFIKYMGELKKVSKEELKKQLIDILEKTDLKDVQDKLIRNLSRGYKQRVSLAGAIIGNPKILILDEPTIGLDPKQITDIRKLIKSLGKQHTVILSSHILSEVSQICDKVIIINKGKIVAIDTPQNLEKNVQTKNYIYITIEETKDINKIVSQIAEIQEFNFVKDNPDGTKQYSVLGKDGKDIRKKIFEVFAKEKITIFELKQNEASLEDAFIDLIKSEEGGKE